MLKSPAIGWCLFNCVPVISVLSLALTADILVRDIPYMTSTAIGFFFFTDKFANIYYSPYSSLIDIVLLHDSANVYCVLSHISVRRQGVFFNESTSAKSS